MRTEEKRIVLLGVFGRRDLDSGISEKRRPARRRSNLKQVFKAGGRWPRLGYSRNYLSPEVGNHNLALGWIHQGDHQQKQHDGRSADEQLVRH
jgi:hypothetical protein